MGFLKKIKDTAEKGVEKGAELGKKGVDKELISARKALRRPKENNFSFSFHF
ncbi:MAG: hypothetical protein OEL84_01710 [Nitrosopumilus sp.]|nr:hypothetical protein [Nitrosopumilus sp.]